jgi:hypothetical protein
LERRGFAFLGHSMVRERKLFRTDGMSAFRGLAEVSFRGRQVRF